MFDSQRLPQGRLRVSIGGLIGLLVSPVTLGNDNAGLVLEEVIVTAHKRTSTVQDPPSRSPPFSGAELVKAGESYN